MTPESYALYNYTYQERIAMLCGSDDPTPEQVQIAKDDANRAVSESEIAEAMERIKQKSKENRNRIKPRSFESRSPYAD